MQVVESFRFFSVILFSIYIVVGGSPLHMNFQGHSSNSHDSRYEEIENGDVYRLPNSVVPVSYELKIVPDLEKFTFAGLVNITVRIEFPTDRIILHSKNLAISEYITITEKGCCDNATVRTATHDVEEQNDVLSIMTGEKFKSNTNYTVSIKFYGYLNETNKGFYRTSYITDDDQTRWLAVTQFETTYARKAFPCFDEPRFRSSFTIHLARSENHTAISNMPSEEILPADLMSNGLLYEKFQQTPPMPTYLVAFMVSDFKQLTDQNQDQRIRVIARPNLVEKGKYALKQATRLLTYFEEYFGIPYPLPKVDVVAVPGFQSGMENWGMTVYGEERIMDEYRHSDKVEITKIISHEFSHLWFGDLVTPAWYDYLWLKEGFAKYFEFFATAAIEPTWNQEEIFIFEQIPKILCDEIFYKRAPTWPIRKFKDIRGSFDPISYDKAAILIRMFELMLSPKTFKSALRRYLIDGQQNQHGVTVQENLFDAFDQQVELDSVSHLPSNVYASDIIKTWVGNLGYPLIIVNRSYEQREVNITQIPYSLEFNRSFDNEYKNQKWIIPLTFATKSQPQFSNVLPHHWSIDNEPVRLTGFNESDWVLFNLKRSGYYRVNYDPKNWQLLIDQLMENHTKIHVLNRAQLIDDVFTLASDRLVDCTLIGRLMKYLRNETNIIPWYTTSEWLLKISKSRSNASKIALKGPLKSFLEKPFKHFGCYSAIDDEIMQIGKLSFFFLKIELGLNPRCVKELLQMYQNNYNNLNNIPEKLKPVLFCYALRHSDDPRTDFEHLWHNYRRSDEIHEKKQILESIFSCTSSEDVIKSVLSKIIDPENKEIHQKDISFILKDFPSEILTITTIIKFIEDRIDTLSNIDTYGIEFLGRLLESIDSKIQTKEQMEMISKLEIKFESLEGKKHMEFTKIIKNIRFNAEIEIIRQSKLEESIPNECLLLNEE